MDKLIQSLANMIYECNVDPREAEQLAKKWVLDNIKTSMWLVINEGHPNFADRWKIFKSKNKAIDHAKECGWESMAGVGDKVGMGSVFMRGTTNITIIPLEVNR